ncbi:hypothetical protein PO002_08640 [Cupriavidus necator]|uniref:hypothetical protein n=1 Tax=Cupriavidus necator TaxID=106590 RepID=UPI0039C4903F
MADMLNNVPGASARVDAAVLLRKAKEWRYEREWRMIGSRGLVDTPLELRDVTFGFRCAESVKVAVIKALKGRNRPVQFYEMQEVHGTFRLRRLLVQEERLFNKYPRCWRSIVESFDDITPI